jgi:hypothetical protein
MERGEALTVFWRVETASLSNAVIARLDRAIQYAVTPVLLTNSSGILDHPLSRMMTIGVGGCCARLHSTSLAV